MWNYQVKNQAKFVLQVNYTDTALSHRFVRFEIPHGHIEEGKAKVQEFVTQCYKDETGTMYYKL